MKEIIDYAWNNWDTISCVSLAILVIAGYIATKTKNVVDDNIVKKTKEVFEEIDKEIKKAKDDKKEKKDDRMP